VERLAIEAIDHRRKLVARLFRAKPAHVEEPMREARDADARLRIARRLIDHLASERVRDRRVRGGLRERGVVSAARTEEARERDAAGLERLQDGGVGDEQERGRGRAGGRGRARGRGGSASR
jgi:hypothetical protein